MGFRNPKALLEYPERSQGTASAIYNIQPVQFSICRVSDCVSMDLRNSRCTSLMK